MRTAGERGGVTVEFAAILPAVLFIILIAFEALMASTTVERVDNAARTGARVAGKEQDTAACPGAALSAMPSWRNDYWADGGPDDNGGVYCHVKAKIPLLFPGVPLDFTVNRTVHMPIG